MPPLLDTDFYLGQGLKALRTINGTVSMQIDHILLVGIYGYPA
jgi:hypothetical protein